MPEISIAEDRNLVTPKHEVWAAREILRVQHEP